MALLTHMMRISLGQLEDQLGVRKFPAFVARCEEGFSRQVTKTVDRLLERPSVHSVFVSGPTSSGKTSFSHRLAQALTLVGRPARVLSLDDYYQTSPLVYDEAGRPDFEALDMLDTQALVEDLMRLFEGETVSLPTFDFARRQRVFEAAKRVTLGEQDILIIEGLHGLSEAIFGHLPAEEVFGVFIMPWCTFLDGRQLLGSRDLRMLRRISRDVIHRGATALSTIDYWPMIDRTEQRLFPAYLARADQYVNSCLPYEFGIIPPLAADRIRESLDQYRQSKHVQSVYLSGQQAFADVEAALAEAEALLAACDRLPRADRSLIPADSILQEFV